MPYGTRSSRNAALPPRRLVGSNGFWQCSQIVADEMVAVGTAIMIASASLQGEDALVTGISDIEHTLKSAAFCGFCFRSNTPWKEPPGPFGAGWPSRKVCQSPQPGISRRASDAIGEMANYLRRIVVRR